MNRKHTPGARQRSPGAARRHSGDDTPCMHALHAADKQTATKKAPSLSNTHMCLGTGERTDLADHGRVVAVLLLELRAPLCRRRQGRGVRVSVDCGGRERYVDAMAQLLAQGCRRNQTPSRKDTHMHASTLDVEVVAPLM